MSGIAIVFLIIAILVLWGGLIASILALRAHPEVAAYPAGDPDDERVDIDLVERDI